MKTALIIDADSILYVSCLTSKENDPDGFIRDTEQAKEKYVLGIEAIIDDLANTHGLEFDNIYQIFGGDSNYRKHIQPTYKIARTKKQIPPLLYFMKAWVMGNPSCFKAVGVEADDVVAKLARQLNDSDYKVVVAAIDKDLKQIPNIYFYDYYPTRKTVEYISQEQADRAKWAMLLTGDITDGVNLTKKTGKVKTEKLLEGCVSEFSYKRAVYTVYKKIWRHKAREKFIEAKLLLWLNERCSTPFDLEI
jgi:hypothetical protein